MQLRHENDAQPTESDANDLPAMLMHHLQLTHENNTQSTQSKANDKSRSSPTAVTLGKESESDNSKFPVDIPPSLQAEYDELCGNFFDHWDSSLLASRGSSEPWDPDEDAHFTPPEQITSYTKGYYITPEHVLQVIQNEEPFKSMPLDLFGTITALYQLITEEGDTLLEVRLPGTSADKSTMLVVNEHQKFTTNLDDAKLLTSQRPAGIDDSVQIFLQGPDVLEVI